MVQPLWKVASWVPTKLHVGLQCDSAIPLLGRYPIELDIGIQAKTCTCLSSSHKVEATSISCWVSGEATCSLSV